MKKNLIKLEWYKVKYPYIISLLISIIYSCLIILPYTSGYSYNHNIEIWQNSNQITDLIFPLIAVLPTCWLMYYERKNNFLIYTITRVSPKKYILYKLLMISLLSALIVFIVSFSGLIFSSIFTSHIGLTGIELQGYDRSLNQFGGYYLVNNPYLYGLVLSLWRAFIGAIVGILGFILSLYIDNIFIILTAPFVYVFISHYILALLGVPYYSIITSFDPSTLAMNAISIERLLVGPTLLLLIIFCTLTYFSKIKKAKIYEI